MWNKRIIITNHAQDRFEQRGIKFSSKDNNIIRQMLFDLRPLNIRTKSHLEGENYKVTTNQGKVYIVKECRDAVFVKTVYKTDVRFQSEYYKEAAKFERRNENKKNNR